MRRAAILAIFVLLALDVAAGNAAEPLPVRSIAIETKGGRQDFMVEIAADDASRAQGLMFRRDLPEHHGMLFDFGDEQDVAFWMKNTLIPLDMLFIDRTGRIARIEEEAEPLSERPIVSGRPVLAVLEIGGGESRRLHIEAGDRVVDRIFKPD